MSELDKYRRVLRPQLRAVWPLLAEAVAGIDGYLGRRLAHTRPG